MNSRQQMLGHEQNHTETNAIKDHNWSYFVTHKHIYNVKYKYFILAFSLKLISSGWYTKRTTPYRQNLKETLRHVLGCIWNVMPHVQKPDFVFQQNGPVHFNRMGLQFSWLLAVKVCASAVVMPDTPRSELVWRVLATHPFASFPFTSLPCVTACHYISTGLYLSKIEEFYAMTLFWLTNIVPVTVLFI
jgi:hypothetical protein